MVRRLGSFFVIRLSKFFCLAMVGSALALGLSACGVKGPLEPPRAAAVEPSVSADPEAPPPPAQAGYAVPGAVGRVEEPRRTSAAVAGAAVAKQRSILDWLVD